MRNILFFAALLFSVTVMAGTQHTMLALSDIHLNPFATCQKKPCALAQRLQKIPAARWDDVFKNQKKAFSDFHQETNSALMSATLNEASRIARKKNVDFIVVVGDFIAHDYKALYRKYTGDWSTPGYRDFVQKTFTYLTVKMQKAFKNKPVYNVVGNNDSYGGDYYMRPNGPFLKDIANLWRQLIIDPENKKRFEQFSKDGFYEIILPKSHQRLIILNSVLYSKHVFGIRVVRGARTQTAWLKSRLMAAKKRGDKVWIVMHVPANIDVFGTVTGFLKRVKLFWKPHYQRAFLRLLRDNPGVVTAVFTGHIHMDALGVLGKAFPVVNVTVPSISPLSGNNPAFKVFYFDKKSFELADVVTYYLPNPHKNKKWHLEYRFNAAYQPNCHPCRLLPAVQKIKLTGQFMQRYQRFYTARHRGAQPFTDKTRAYYWCAISHALRSEYRQCLT